MKCYFIAKGVHLTISPRSTQALFFLFINVVGQWYHANYFTWYVNKVTANMRWVHYELGNNCAVSRRAGLILIFPDALSAPLKWSVVLNVWTTRTCFLDHTLKSHLAWLYCWFWSERSDIFMQCSNVRTPNFDQNCWLSIFALEQLPQWSYSIIIDPCLQNASFDHFSATPISVIRH